MTGPASGRLDMSTGTIATHTPFHFPVHPCGPNPPTPGAALSPNHHAPGTTTRSIDQEPTNLLGHVHGAPGSTAGAVDLMNIATERAAKAFDAGAGESSYDLIARAAEAALLTNESASPVPVIAPTRSWMHESTAAVPVVPRQRHRKRRQTVAAGRVPMTTATTGDGNGVDEQDRDDRVMTRFLAITREFDAGGPPAHHRRPQQQPHSTRPTPSRTGGLQPHGAPRPGEAESVLARRHVDLAEDRVSVLLPELVGRAGHLTPAQADRAGYGERRRASHPAQAPADTTAEGGRRRAGWPRDPLEPEAGRSQLSFRHDDSESGRVW
jgi:hypothetical protein